MRSYHSVGRAALLVSISKRCYSASVTRSLWLCSLALLAPLSALAETQTASTAQGFDHKRTLDDVAARAANVDGRIAAAQARVLQLRESVVKHNTSATRGLIVHHDDMNASFTLETAIYELDGVEILNKSAKPGVELKKDFDVLTGDMKPGDHKLVVSFRYLGTGLGSYPGLNGMHFLVKSTYTFPVFEGRLTKVSVIPYTRPEATIDPQQRFAVRYEHDILALGASTTGTP